ncbi:hypothetical protein ACROYT_G004533 [Oculina patagonica]
MKLLNKTEQIAHLNGRNGNTAIQEMLTGYRSTPHPATGVTPYEALMNRQDHTNRREMYRDASQFKIANALTQDNASEERDEQDKEPTSEDWRDKILLNANPHSVHEETTTSKEEIITSTAETSSSDKPEAVTRPRRDRRRPDYLKDYVT